MINKFSNIFLAKTICIIVIFFFNIFNLFSQTENQFTNEFQYNTNIGKLTALEFDFTQDLQVERRKTIYNSNF